jgi:hypothetical protein
MTQQIQRNMTGFTNTYDNRKEEKSTRYVDPKAITQTRGADMAKKADHCGSNNSNSSHVNTVQSYTKPK